MPGLRNKFPELNPGGEMDRDPVIVSPTSHV